MKTLTLKIEQYCQAPNVELLQQIVNLGGYIAELKNNKFTKADFWLNSDNINQYYIFPLYDKIGGDFYATRIGCVKSKTNFK